MVAVNKAQQLLQGLQASGDEGQQLTAVIEMCQVSGKQAIVFSTSFHLCFIMGCVCRQTLVPDCQHHGVGRLHARTMFTL